MGESSKRSPDDRQGSKLWTAILSSSVAVLLLSTSYRFVNVILAEAPELSGYDPCCDYPCQNLAVCVPDEFNDYTCDCTSTGYYGSRCTIPEVGTLVSNLIPDAISAYGFLTSQDWLWNLVNGNDKLRDQFTAHLYLSMSDFTASPPTFESEHTFITGNAFFNRSLYTRSLPPVPSRCPTPMGTKGPKELPDIDVLMNKLFARKEFIPDPQNSNLLFQYYALHFGRQFVHGPGTGPQLFRGTGEMDASHIYGAVEEDRLALRSGINGKLRSQILNGEEFPPVLPDEPNMSTSEQVKNQTFALADPMFSSSPGLFVFATIWLREHNRVCDELLEVHSDWDDQRLYETARLIVSGEMVKITLEDFVQHLSQYKLDLSFNPELLHGTRFQFHNRIHAEFKYLFDWHPFVADYLLINEANYSVKEYSSSLDPLFNEGIDKFIEALLKTRAGEISARNHGESMYPFLKEALKASRELRFQGINAYRRRLGLRPFSTFEDLTGEKETAAILEEMYEDVDAVEYYVGLLMERSDTSISGLTMMNMAVVWTVKSIYSNPVCSHYYWKPSTFGGKVGWDIIQKASLQRLFCRNMRTQCRDLTFTVLF
ncbi:prostaglandin G/H synthase 1-like isoform X1 [Macrobrachium nipponense]|uniref:prostaglandin G/H synthase 1-like isoform X1 n=1 Tax=Macrobrachium nipponense TaxID=159736 RepID=UPI0030C8165C